MEHSSFANVPNEVLNSIFRLALHDPEKVTLDFTSEPQGRAVRIGGQPHLLALTETCRKIRKDTRLVFYDANDFVALIGRLSWHVRLTYRSEPIRRFRGWLQERGFENARCIRTLEVQGLVFRRPVRPGESIEPADTAIRALGPVARFFAGTGASIKLTLDFDVATRFGCGKLFVTIDNLPLDNLKAAYLEASNTCERYISSWQQSHLDNCIRFRAYAGWGLLMDPCEYFAREVLLRIQDRIDEEPGRRNWLFEEEANLKRKKPNLTVAMKMPESWVDKVKKQKGQ